MDAVLEKAVDLARAAAIEAAEGEQPVGAHLSAHEDGDRLVTHLFACTLPGYRGWVWSVTVARAPRAREATVCEAHLVPADDALLAPSWVPWAERIRPGDLEASMVLPLIQEDPRLVPGFEETGDEDLDELAIWELGLGRERVLGPEGRDSAAERWMRGSHGPTAASAIASTSPCSTCAFFVPLSGSMRTAFGACANEWSPSDGRVVAVDHGCGAHSQTDVEKQSSKWPAVEPVIDTDAAVSLDLSETEPEPVPEATTAADAVPEDASTETADATVADAPAPTEKPVDAAAPESPVPPESPEAPEATDVSEPEPASASGEPPTVEDAAPTDDQR
ncbi:DUF3027 domain-containing protein [Demequina activiva]|uniref:DUF3027 domain-containing protein n=1 Tax=Demequina activiva TaxID=1582364 RepID=A0A919Q0E9_9MICO|nr:DUF3027 domain-containing protein [Demequina activiva]GIG53704.1 hypothetical protein Dac01nite_04560 [Demequina activiva]